MTKTVLNWCCVLLVFNSFVLIHMFLHILAHAWLWLLVAVVAFETIEDITTTRIRLSFDLDLIDRQNEFCVCCYMSPGYDYNHNKDIPLLTTFINHINLNDWKFRIKIIIYLIGYSKQFWYHKLISLLF